MPAALSMTLIILIFTAGRHVSGNNIPASPPSLVKFINKANPYKNMLTDDSDIDIDEDDSGGYVNTNKWNMLDLNKKTDARGRIHINGINIGKDIRVFVSDVDQELEICNNKLLLPYPTFKEVRKSRAKNQIGEHLKVQNNGDVWTTQKNKHVKIFIRM